MSKFKYNPKKIYCANCLHCKVIRKYFNKIQYKLRVHCYLWDGNKTNNKEYRHDTVLNRIMDSCDSYHSMGDPLEFLEDLAEDLPNCDMVYQDNG